MLFHLRVFVGNEPQTSPGCCVLVALAMCSSDRSLPCCSAYAYEVGIGFVARRLTQSTLTQDDIPGGKIALEEEAKFESFNGFSQESLGGAFRKWGIEELIGLPLFSGQSL